MNWNKGIRQIHRVVSIVAVIVFLTLAGVAFSEYAPDAKSIGAVVEKWRADH